MKIINLDAATDAADHARAERKGHALNATQGAQIVTDAMQSQATRELNASMDALAATALRIRDERDEACAALRDIILALRLHLDSGLWSGAAWLSSRRCSRSPKPV